MKYREKEKDTVNRCRIITQIKFMIHLIKK